MPDLIKKVDMSLLHTIADMDSMPTGAFNIRKNGQGIARQSSENITIEPKKGNPGIDIYIKPFTKGEEVHIPVIITETGINDKVYNDFYVGEGADVLIVAGCGIHNCGEKGSGVSIIIVMLVGVVCCAVAYFFTLITRFAISRKREYMADAGGAELCGNPLALASALRKISGAPGLQGVQRQDVAQLFIIHPQALTSGMMGWKLMQSLPVAVKRRV